MSVRASDFRQVGRQWAADKTRQAGQQAIEDAYQAVLAARDVYDAAPAGNNRAEFAAFDAAVDHLIALAPRHHYFS